jgi:hypothetical protein
MNKTKISEEWRPVPSLPNKYQVSNLGRLRSKDKILKQSIGNHGYPVVNLGSSGYHLVHRLVATAFCSKNANEDFVDHLNSIRSDNRTINLEWVTRAENNKRQYIAKGIEKPQSKLIPKDVIHIRDEHSSGVSINRLARGYGISTSSMRDAILRRTWKHV